MIKAWQKKKSICLIGDRASGAYGEEMNNARFPPFPQGETGCWSFRTCFSSKSSPECVLQVNRSKQKRSSGPNFFHTAAILLSISRLPLLQLICDNGWWILCFQNVAINVQNLLFFEKEVWICTCALKGKAYVTSDLCAYLLFYVTLPSIKSSMEYTVYSLLLCFIQRGFKKMSMVKTENFFLSKMWHGMPHFIHFTCIRYLVNFILCK